jgi:hypothetical protein
MTPQDEANRRRVHDAISALKAACRASHSGGPGGSRMCICGASCGGSAACTGLSFIKDALRYPHTEYAQYVREIL